MLACGCGERPGSATARFRMGHDAKLKGVLARAHASGSELALFAEDTGIAETMTAAAYAAQFSSDKIDWVGGPERIVLERFAERTAHPNPKRGLLVEGLRQRYPAGQGVDARILNTDSAARRGPKLGDDDYPAVVGRAWHNINISGFRRSLPFRFIDSFLVGASVPSDEIALRWYAPFDMTNEVIDLGPMGYELDGSVDWQRVWTVFDGLMSEPPNRRDERRQHIVQRFETLWHPRAFARYVVDQCLQHMG